MNAHPQERQFPSSCLRSWWCGSSIQTFSILLISSDCSCHSAWLASLIRRAEFPGGLKIEFRDVEAAGSRITGSATGSADTNEEPQLFAGAVDADPNLVLVGFRIELERRLRELARRYSMNDQQSLMRILRQLRERGVLSHPMLSGLQELVRFGNEAAHGARVDEAAVSWARDVGPRILAMLDERLATGE